MKNIHVLPTDKPSRIIFDFDENNYLPIQEEDVRMENQHLVQNRNIYITSDEVKKKGDYVLSNTGEIVRFCSLYCQNLYKKIILTTDQDLIKDGVQAIDDEFLEWFVKNPSCEFVEVEDFPMTEKYNSKGEYVHNNYWIYKIIIPKEEPIDEEVECNNCGNIMSLLPDNSIHVCFNNECTSYYEYDEDDFIEEPKQETLEEASDRVYTCGLFSTKTAFIAGAKWQEQRMYSEEEVLEIIRQYALEEHLITSSKPDIWFEQFKKK